MIEIDLIIGPSWDEKINWSRLSEISCYAGLDNSDYKNLKKLDYIFSISILLSNSEDVHALNKQYRDKDKPTNILSFPMLNIDELHNIENQQTPEIMLGDMILSYQICQKEAETKKIDLTDHFQHLVIHGVLHLLGYNHIEDNEADIMQNIEIKALEQLGIDNPYKKG